MGRWIKIYEEIREHWIYQNPLWYRWWTDMLFEASFKDSKILVRKQIVELKRGQLSGSISYFVKRWNTSKDQVIGFLKSLQNEGMIDKVSDKNVTIITICNYDSYQGRTDNKTDSLYDNKSDNMPDNNPDTNKEGIEGIEIKKNKSNACAREENVEWDESRENGFVGRFKAQGCGMKVSRTTGLKAADIMTLLDAFTAKCELRNKGHRDFDHFINRFLWAVQNKWVVLPVQGQQSQQKKVIEGQEIFNLYK